MCADAERQTPAATYVCGTCGVRSLSERNYRVHVRRLVAERLRRNHDAADELQFELNNWGRPQCHVNLASLEGGGAVERYAELAVDDLLQRADTCQCNQLLIDLKPEGHHAKRDVAKERRCMSAILEMLADRREKQSEASKNSMAFFRPKWLTVHRQTGRASILVCRLAPVRHDDAMHRGGDGGSAPDSAGVVAVENRMLLAAAVFVTVAVLSKDFYVAGGVTMLMVLLTLL